MPEQELFTLHYITLYYITLHYIIYRYGFTLVFCNLHCIHYHGKLQLALYIDTAEAKLVSVGLAQARPNNVYQSGLHGIYIYINSL